MLHDFNQVTTQSGLFWEPLETNEGVVTTRAKVPGGWLVRDYLRGRLSDGQQAMVGNIVFIPDVNHTWTIKSEFKS